MPKPDPSDPVLEALDELVTTLEKTTEFNQAAIRRARVIRRLRESGRPYKEILPIEERPLIIELLTDFLSELSEASSRFRKAEARALYSEGLTMEEIAGLFGVTRQRVAALLRSPDGTSDKQRQRPSLGRSRTGHAIALAAIAIDSPLLGL